MEYFYLFLIIIVLVITPGPDTGLVTKNTFSYGKRGGTATILGIVIGLMIHTFLAIVGLSAMLFDLIKNIGARLPTTESLRSNKVC